MLKKGFKYIALAAATFIATEGMAAGDRFVTIGTGGVTGVYYPTGGSICRLMNKGKKEHKIRCTVESTGGSVYNVNAIASGELDFGVVQSDVQSNAIQGIKQFKEVGKQGDLRAIFSVHPEPVHVMVNAAAGVSKFEDLAGKRFNIGNPGSGQRALAEIVMDQLGWTKETFKVASELKSAEQAGALCDGKFEGTFWAAGLPNGSAQEATSTCDVRIVPMQGKWLDDLLAGNPAYARATVPGGMYANNPNDIPSFGPKATFVTSANNPDEVVYHMVKAVFDNFETFKKLHPAFTRLDPKEMIKDGLTAPLHPGAVKYYKEKGWM